VGLIDEAVAAIQAGKLVILPLDTVYGICSSPYRDEPTRRIYRLKRRPETMPSALVCANLEMLIECVPELRGRAGLVARALLPGPYTLVLPNPARRYRWLTGINPETIGVRVPQVEGPCKEILDRAGAVVATSANLHGAPDPRRLDEVPDELKEAAAVVVDGGEVLGVPSTVLDFTEREPKVLREGAAPAAEAIQRATGAAR
jgi:L-threonylcarbamoyladenylate synthase